MHPPPGEGTVHHRYMPLPYVEPMQRYCKVQTVMFGSAVSKERLVGPTPGMIVSKTPQELPVLRRIVSCSRCILCRIAGRLLRPIRMGCSSAFSPWPGASRITGWVPAELQTSSVLVILAALPPPLGNRDMLTPREPGRCSRTNG